MTSLQFHSAFLIHTVICVNVVPWVSGFSPSVKSAGPHAGIKMVWNESANWTSVSHSVSAKEERQWEHNSRPNTYSVVIKPQGIQHFIMFQEYQAQGNQSTVLCKILKQWGQMEEECGWGMHHVLVCLIYTFLQTFQVRCICPIYL